MLLDKTQNGYNSIKLISHIIGYGSRLIVSACKHLCVTHTVFVQDYFFKSRFGYESNSKMIK